MPALFLRSLYRNDVLQKAFHPVFMDRFWVWIIYGPSCPLPSLGADCT